MVEFVLEERRGLKASRKDAKYTEFNGSENGHTRLEEYILKRMNSFKYSGSIMSDDDELDQEIEIRMQG